jgi:hypothetical protein
MRRPSKLRAEGLVAACAASVLVAGCGHTNSAPKQKVFWVPPPTGPTRHGVVSDSQAEALLLASNDTAGACLRRDARALNHDVGILVEVYAAGGPRAAHELDPGMGKVTTRRVLSSVAASLNECDAVTHTKFAQPAIDRLTATLSRAPD